MNVILSDLITLGPEFNYFNLMQTDYLRRPPGAVSIININIQMIISQEPFIEIDPTLYQNVSCMKPFRFPCNLAFQDGRHVPVSQFILPPGQVAPRGASQPWTGCPPGGNVSRDILPPTLVIFTPGGRHIPAGLSCPPGVKINQPGYLAPLHDSGAVTVQKF